MKQRCTKDNPYTPERDNPEDRWEHDGIVEVDQRDGYPGGDIIKWRCMNCGLEGESELPQ